MGIFYQMKSVALAEDLPDIHEKQFNTVDEFYTAADKGYNLVSKKIQWHCLVKSVKCSGSKWHKLIASTTTKLADLGTITSIQTLHHKDYTMAYNKQQSYTVHTLHNTFQIHN